MAVRCPSCGKTFGGTTPFDVHRIGAYEIFEAGKRIQRNTRRCMSEDEMRRAGLAPLTRGLWGQPAYPKGVTTLTPLALS